MKMRRFVAIALVMLMAFALCSCSGSDYKKAEELFAAGNYAEAIALYKGLAGNDYKDSADKLLECQYQCAEALFAQKDYGGAAEYYESPAYKNYKDAAKKLPQSKYLHADTLFKNKKFGEAADIYDALAKEKYQDAAKKATESKYLNAAALFDKKDYSGAADIYAKISDYKDAKSRGTEANYYVAKSYADNKEYQQAFDLFCKLGDYKDSHKQAKTNLQKLLADVKVGDSFTFGRFEQDGKKDNGKEPLKWTVLAANKNYKLLITENLIVKRPFHEDVLTYTNDWEDCELREWMNKSFYNKAFTKGERGFIQKMITSSKTKDKVFCLSSDEAQAFFETDEARQAAPTQYLLDKEFDAWQGWGHWWTRSTGTHPGTVVKVEADGEVAKKGDPVRSDDAYTDTGVRAVIVISSAPVSDAKNMKMFGVDSNASLDNEKEDSGNSDSGKCPNCNGTGVAKFYYGSSDLEAYMDGHDPYWYDTCPLCNGTGKS